MSDANDFAPVASSAGPLFAQIGDATGPFAESKVTPSTIERVVGEMIWRHKGRTNPISIAKLAAATGESERSIKGIVEQLVVTHRMKVGGKRSEPVGYFVVVDAEDLDVAIRPYRDQVVAMWRRLRVLASARTLREMHGQLVIGDGEGGEDIGR